MSVGDAPTVWRELPAGLRAALAGRLAGLYGAPDDSSAFDALALDKQKALELFARRLSALKLWGAVGRVENVYGAGGVGMSFTASPLLAAALRLSDDFTTLLAARRPNDGGFRERRVRRAALHFLYSGGATARRWSVHFDLYNPLSSPAGAWHHFFHEYFRAATPDWRAVEGALAAEARAHARQKLGRGLTSQEG